MVVVSRVVVAGWPAVCAEGAVVTVDLLVVAEVGVSGSICAKAGVESARALTAIRKVFMGILHH